MAKPKNRRATASRKSEAQRGKKKPVSKKRKPQQEYDNEMRGVLFRNKKKTKESQPDMTGSAEIEGVEYWVSAWSNESKQGQKFLSLAFTVKEESEDEDDEDDEDEEREEDDLPF